MIPLSKAPEAYTPEWLCDETGAPKKGAPVFHIRPGSLTEREQFEAELSSPPWNAAKVWPYELFDEMVSAARAWLPDPAQLARVVEKIELARRDMLGEDAEGVALVTALEESCLATPGGWPAYKALHARRVRRNQYLPFLAAHRFLSGWESASDVNGAAIGFALDPSTGLVADDALAGLPPLILKAVGVRAYRFLRGEKARPFSVSPSSSSATPPTSTSGVKRRRGPAGRSKARSTEKTQS